MKIMVYNRQKSQTITKEITKLIEKAAKLCVKKENFPYPCEAYITLSDNDAIREMNRDHRGIDKPTDVLSFPLVEYVNGKPDLQPGDIDPETNCVSLGDIVISVEKAKEQADSYGHTQMRELAFLAVHGMLHLLGCDHENEEEEKKMFCKQEEVLNEMGLVR